MKIEKRLDSKCYRMISFIALAWFLLMAFLFYNHYFLSEGFQGSQSYINQIPLWSISAFIVYLFSGILGCLALIFKNKEAQWLLWVSLIAMFVRISSDFFVFNDMEFPRFLIYVHVIVIGFSVCLVRFSKYSEKKNCTI